MVTYLGVDKTEDIFVPFTGLQSPTKPYKALQSLAARGLGPVKTPNAGSDIVSGHHFLS